MRMTVMTIMFDDGVGRLRSVGDNCGQRASVGRQLVKSPFNRGGQRSSCNHCISRSVADLDSLYTRVCRTQAAGN